MTGTSMALAAHLSSAVALAGRFPVLAGVDLDVAEGDVVAVQGPNGAGKTSLLRMCCGLLAVTSGTAEVLGHDLLRDRTSVRRDVAMLGHGELLYDDLTARENLVFSLSAARVDRSAAETALARFGVTGRLADTPVAKLSAGQRRRVVLAALVARSAKLWLLDEPHAGLDAEARDLLDEAIRDARATGTTVLLASHETERSMLVADRVVTMAGGTVADPGTGRAGGRAGSAETHACREVPHVA